MRVGIDYRILTVGPSAVTRGMPRYTQQQLREVLARGIDDEFVLLCDPRSDQSLILPEIRRAPNVSVRVIPESLTVDCHRDETMLERAEMFETWLDTLRLDLYHATTPFYLDQLLVTQHDVCPYVATVYDLIPLIYPSQYLGSEKLRQLYVLAATMVRRATRLLAISHAARRDASHYLGFPEDRIDVASPIAEPFFRPLPDGEAAAALVDLRGRLALAGPFILTVADLHFTKNLETLLRAYARLAPSLRVRLPLVVACHLSAEHEAYLAALAGKLGVAGQVVTTGLVSDHELVALYNTARFLVHPSRFEGFGLPVLEAMQCGTPVIATTSASLPEVAGDAAVLVDPDDAPALAEAMRMLDEDSEQRDDLRERGLVRASTFTGAALGDATATSYRRAAASEPEPKRPRIAIWTPLPPLRTGVAEYSAQLGGPLQEVCDVEFFVDDGYLPSLELLAAHRVRHFRAFERLAARFDGVVYQLGASVFHLYMEEAIHRHPGVVVLHDLVWSHLVHHRWAEEGDIDRFRRQLLALEGAAAVAEYDNLDRTVPDGWGERLRAFLDQHLMLSEVVSASSAQIVHFPTAVDELATRYPDARPTYVPMGVADPFEGRPTLRAVEARARVGIAPDAFVVGVFGVVDEVKRVEATVAAVAEVARRHPNTLLDIVGPVLDAAYGKRLLELARRENVLGAVRMTGEVPPELFAEHLAAADVVVNLRFPSKKQMSATLLRAAAAGKPLVISDLPEWAFLPSTFCRRVPASDDDARALAVCLSELAGDPDLRSEASKAALAYHRAEATVAAMAAGYTAVLERIVGQNFEVAAPIPGQDDTLPVRRSTPDMRLNKVCEIEDFADPVLASVVADVFSYKLADAPPGYPRGSEYRKEWEIAMAVRTLRETGALRPDSIVLGVGAGTEDTTFYLTRHVARVVATDRYLAPGAWRDVAPAAMLIDPCAVAPYEFDRSRLVVQHMDGRHLRFPDDRFDAVYSSGSIEHFGDLEDIAAAAYEMGRVLKPGGVLTLSTEILLSGPPGGKGLPGTLLFSPADLRRYIVEAGGLEPVDELQLEVSEPTLASQRDLARAIRRRERLGTDPDQAPRRGDPGLDLPHLVVVCDGYVFTSVHLALRKTERYPAAQNGWARPSARLIRQIDEDNRRLLGAGGTANGHNAPTTPAVDVQRPPPPTSWRDRAVLADRLAGETAARAEAVRGSADTLLALLGDVDGEVERITHDEHQAAASVVRVGTIIDDLAHLPGNVAALTYRDRTSASRGQPPHGVGWRWCDVAVLNGPRFGVMVDPDMRDEITVALQDGGRALDWTSVYLMLALVRPGDVVVDLGAYVGTFTLAAAAAGCQVVAFEASPRNAALLRASVARNGFDQSVSVFNAAVGDAPGEVRFLADGPYGFVGEGEGMGDRRGLVVPAVTVDAVLEELGVGAVSMVKMDVEGSEIRALRGMRTLLGGETAPPLLFESNGFTLRFYGARPADLQRDVEELGYRIFLVDPGRLSAVPPGHRQLQTAADYLAVKGKFEGVGGWRVEGPLSADERIARLVQECGRPSPYTEGQRAYVAESLAEAEPELLQHREIVALLDGMRADPAENVRAAAAWSATAGSVGADIEATR